MRPENKKMKMKKKLLLLGLLVLLNAIVFGQSNFWTPLSQDKIEEMEGEKIYTYDVVAQTYSLELKPLRIALKNCPSEGAAKGKVVRLPMADGQFMDFEMFDSPIMQAGLAAKYPTIKTFWGKSVDNPSINGRFSISEFGFHGYIFGLGSPVIIDPIFHGNNQVYQSFFRKDLHDRENPEKAFICDVTTENQGTTDDTKIIDPELTLGSPETEAVQLRTYRLVIATTGEYSQKYGNTKASVLAEVTNAINRINSIVGRDFALKYELTANTDTMFYFDAATDPYTNGNTSAMIGENPTALNSKIPFNHYDMGHVFGTNGGGLAQISSVCGGGKGRGVTSAGGNTGDGFYVDYVAHEMGHQMGSNHTFNNCSGFAGGNENGGTAYEPGSGSTIMSYSGICGTNNILFDSDPYYHVSSLMEITDHMILTGGNSCAAKSNTDNHYPVANTTMEDGFFIPIGTAFLLNGEGMDEDGDQLTYSWEQFDLGPLSPLGSPQGDAPLFRALPPKDVTYRFFPRLGTIFSGSFDNKEVLPSYSRNMTFQFVVRDNHTSNGMATGAAAWDKVAFKATEEAGPFIVTLPGLNDKIWEVGEYAKVKWLVANTDKAPVNCHLVNIRLIHGMDYDNSILLAENVGNTGEAYVVVPDMVATNYRVIVEAADNVFLDASGASHEIKQPVEPKLSAGLSQTGLQICVPATEQIVLNTVGIGGYTGVANLSLLGDLPAGANVYFESASINAGESTNLILDFENVADFSPIDLQVLVKGDNVDSTVMNLHLDVVDFNFSGLGLTSPANGAAGVSSFPVLDWTALGNATKYDVQIASSPSFDANSLHKEKLGTTATTLLVNNELEVATVYYWRVRAYNECGVGPWTVPASFSTVNVSCASTDATDVPMTISANTPGTKTSTIHIGTSATVNDLNVKHLTGNHDYLGELSIKLTAPSGESAILMANKCANTSVPFDLSFDDDAVNNDPCVLTGKSKPEQPFTVFHGVDAAGDWVLSVTDGTPGSGGKITGWSIELCADVTFNAPVLVKNEVLDINDGVSEVISSSLLLAEDVDNGPAELIFTIVTAPKYGVLKVNGTELSVGATFSQEDVSAGALRYYNSGASSLVDDFNFSVIDGQGGFIPVTKFNIMREPVGVELVENQDFSIYPNPVKDWVNIDFDKQLVGMVDIRLVDVVGKVVKQIRKKDINNIQFSTVGVAPGAYFVRIYNNGNTAVAKIVVLK